MVELQVIPNSKTCSKCKSELPLTEFTNQVRGLYKKRSRCRKCESDVRLAVYTGLTADAKLRARINRHKKKKERKVWFDAIKNSLKCSRCTESRAVCLDFHHINPSEKEHSMSFLARSGSFSKETVLREIAKCMVLCANCHRIEHADG
jgi:hypothetical protein